MVKDLKEILIKLGFSEAEAEVYVFLFKKGSATISEIQAGISIPRSTIYVVLNKFRDSGLISCLESKPHREYIIESPRQIMNFIRDSLEKIKQEYRKREQFLEEAIPKFLSQQSSEKPRVRFFEGVNGIKNIRDDVRSTNPEIVYNLYNWDQVESSLLKNKDFVDREGEKPVQVKKSVTIYHSERCAIKPVAGNEGCYFTEEKINAEIVVYGDKVAMVDYKSKDNIMATIVENKNIADSLISLYKMAIRSLNKR